MPYPNYTPQELSAINAYLQAEAVASRDQRNLLVEINAELTKQISNVKAASKQYNVLEDISRKLQNDAEDMSKLTDKQLDKEKGKAQAALRDLKASAEKLAVEKGIVNIQYVHLGMIKKLEPKELALLSALQNQFTIEEETLGLIEKRIDFTKNLNKSVGLTGTLLGSVSKITDRLGLHGVDYIFEDAATAAQNQAKALGVSDVNALGLVGKMKVMLTVVKPLASGLFKAFSDPLTLLTLQIGLFKKFYSLAIDLDTTLTDTGKALGYSREETDKLYNKAALYSSTVDDIFITTTDLLQAQIKLNQTLGTNVEYNFKNAEAASRLSHFYGLSEESIGKMTELAVQQNTTSLDILKSTAETYTLQRKQYGGSISFNKVLDKIANVSDEIYVRFKGNSETIAQAVMQSDRLGLSLEKTNQIGDALLNFESSIENQLKAQLLTGKNINIEKARQYALDGDTVKLAAEIAKQVGNIHEFEKMNVIQRKAYAEAFGMSVQDMSSMLRKREFEAKLSDDIKKSAEKTLEYADKHGLKLDDATRVQYEQKSLVDEQHELFKKLRDVLEKITKGPMQTFLHMMKRVMEFASSIIENLNKMSGGGLGNALGAAILGAPLLIGGIKVISGGLKGLLFQKGTFANPMITQSIGGAGGLIGGGGSMASSVTRGLVGKFGAGGTRNLIRGAKGFGIGAGIGLGADLIASQMDEGVGKDTMSGISTTASWAGTGAMVGSIIPGVGTAVGAVLGGVAGSIKALFDAEASAREREEKAKQKREDQQKATNDLLQQFIDRPVQLNVGGKTILDFNTASNLYGNQRSSFA